VDYDKDVSALRHAKKCLSEAKFTVEEKDGAVGVYFKGRSVIANAIKKEHAQNICDKLSLVINTEENRLGIMLSKINEAVTGQMKLFTREDVGGHK